MFCVMRRFLKHLQQMRFVPKCRKNDSNSFIVVGAFCLIAIALLYGTLLRSGDQSTKNFWIDEVWRAQQILHAESYSELRDGKYFGGEAPVQYSEFLQGKLGLSIFGKSEIAFRIWPWVFSLLSLAIFTFIAWSLLSPGWCALSVLLFSLGIGYVEHAHEFKPYSLEVFLVLSVYAIGVALDRWNERLRWLFPVLFVLMAAVSNIWIFYIFVPVFVLYRLPPKFAAWGLLLLSGVGLLATVFVGIYYSNYVTQLESNRIFSFWKGYYLSNFENLISLYKNTLPRTMWWYVVSYSASLKTSSIAGFLILFMSCLVGSIVFWHQRCWAWVFIVLPLVGQLILSVLGVYPVFSRVATFYYPILILSLCACGNALCVWAMPRRGYVMEVLLLICITVAGWQFYVLHGFEGHSGYKRHVENIKPLLAVLPRGDLAQEKIYANYGALLALSFYDPALRMSVINNTIPNTRKLSVAQAELFLNEEFDRNQGVTLWLLGYHVMDGHQIFSAAAKNLELAVCFDQKNTGAYVLAFNRTQC